MSAATFLYLIEAKTGLVKIGTSVKPATRLAVINTHSPIPCRLVAVWPGDREDELQLHEAFHQFRGHNEWFRIEGEVVDFVEALRWRGVEPTEYPPETDAARRWQEVRRRAKHSASLRMAWAKSRGQSVVSFADAAA